MIKTAKFKFENVNTANYGLQSEKGTLLKKVGITFALIAVSYAGIDRQRTHLIGYTRIR